jgi:hypothetical protein
MEQRGSVDLGWADLPGAEWVAQGLQDLDGGRETVSSLLVASFASRLRLLGLHVPEHRIVEPELLLFRLLERQVGGGAHARYNSMLQRMVSFTHTYRCVK